MRYMPRFFVLLSLWIAAASLGWAQLDSVLSGKLRAFTTMGTDYWIAIAPNEINPYQVEDLHVYMCSPFDGEAVVTDAATGRTIKRKLLANTVTTLSDATGELNWTMEVREAESAIPKAIRLQSDVPMSVYVLNSKTFSTDGYLAIPTRAWGKNYIPCGYYDFKEMREWAGGFIIVAGENGTSVDITLRGTGGLDAQTSGGKKIGQLFSVVLNAGEVYMVRGDSKTRGLFDLTGTKITSDKKIGLISFHERTTMPNLLTNGNGRNHLVEMIPPVDAWSTRYTSLELKRNSTGNGRGDIFRVVAKESGTKWTVNYYNKQTMARLGEAGGLLTSEGHFQDIVMAGLPTAAIEGFSVWSADKPILVMQYSASSSWDGDQKLDPFMVLATPVDRYASAIQFQAARSSQVGISRLHLIVRVDSLSTDHEASLKSITLNGVPLWNHPGAEEPGLLKSRTPNGDYWAAIALGDQAGILSSNGSVRMGGYLYGHGQVDAYGWPLAGHFADHIAQDTLPPVTRVTPGSGHGSRKYTIEEKRNSPTIRRDLPLATDQVESGIARVDSVPGSRSTNVQYTINQISGFEWQFEVQVVDCSKPASLTFYCSDWRGNVATDTFSYQPGTMPDTASPIVTSVTTTRTRWVRSVTDSGTYNASGGTEHCDGFITSVQSGIQNIFLEQALTTNFDLTVQGPLSSNRAQPTFVAGYTLQVENSSANAFALVRVTDWEGNQTIDSVRYSAPVSVEDDIVKPGYGGKPIANISVFDLTGRMVTTISNPVTPLSTHGLPAGLLLVVETDVRGNRRVYHLVSVP